MLLLKKWQKIQNKCWKLLCGEYGITNLKVRAKSVGEVSSFNVLCPDDGKTYAKCEVNLTDVKVQVDDNHTNKIELGNGTGMIMQYPTINSFADTGIKTITAENMLDKLFQLKIV